MKSNRGEQNPYKPTSSCIEKQANNYRIRPLMPIPRRGNRKKTLSLNPEEREALENLIEEVIMDGGIADSDSGSSDTDEHLSADDHTLKVVNFGVDKSGKPLNKKYYPGQLKVALKHMSELPPRFSRKLKRAEKYLELNLAQKEAMAEASRIVEEEEDETREEKKLSANCNDKTKTLEIKKAIRYLLTDLDQYVDEKDRNGYSVPIDKLPGAISCSEFENEALNSTKSLLQNNSNSFNNENKNNCFQYRQTIVNKHNSEIENISQPLNLNFAPNNSWNIDTNIINKENTQIFLNNSNQSYKEDTSQPVYDPTFINLSSQSLYVANVPIPLDSHLNLQYSHYHNKTPVTQSIQQQLQLNEVKMNQNSYHDTVPLIYSTIIMPTYGYQKEVITSNNYALPSSHLQHQIMYPPPNFQPLSNLYQPENQFILFNKPPPVLPISFYNETVIHPYIDKVNVFNHSHFQSSYETKSSNNLKISNIKQSASSLETNKLSISSNHYSIALKNIHKKENIFNNVEHENKKPLVSSKLFKNSSNDNIHGNPVKVSNKNSNFNTGIVNSCLSNVSQKSFVPVYQTSTFTDLNSTIQNVSNESESQKTIFVAEKAISLPKKKKVPTATLR